MDRQNSASSSPMPAGKPLGVRISCTDWIEGGWDLEQTVAFARELKKLGCDWIDCSSGGLMKNQAIPVGPGYQVPFAERIRKDAGIITIAIGLITEAGQAERIIAEGKADMVALARLSLGPPLGLARGAGIGRDAANPAAIPARAPRSPR